MDRITITTPESILSHIQETFKNAYEFTMTIYHFIIGSKMESFNPDPHPDSIHVNRRNHEYPQLVRNLFENPYQQFSDELLTFSSSKEFISIRQIVILIDPQYSRDPKIERQNDIPINNNLNYYLIPENISISQVNYILEAMNLFINGKNILIHILDCTSYLLTDLYINNTNPQIYINKPDCLALDYEPRYLPYITLSRHSGNHSNHPDLYRWVNLKDDFLNSNPSAFLKVLRLNYLLEISLYSLSKLWSIYTYNFAIPNSQSIIFTNLLFGEFVRLLRDPIFIDGLLHYIDYYYHANVRRLLMEWGYGSLAPYEYDKCTPIIEVIKREIWKNMKEVGELHSGGMNMPARYELLERRDVLDFLEKFKIG
jgi:hypothetical protein